jgi:hypothetical protein
MMPLVSFERFSAKERISSMRSLLTPSKSALAKKGNTKAKARRMPIEEEKATFIRGKLCKKVELVEKRKRKNCESVSDRYPMQLLSK